MKSREQLEQEAIALELRLGMKIGDASWRRPWRTGRKVYRTIYVQLGDEPSNEDPLIGLMDTPKLAQEAVEAHNERLQK